MSEPTLFADGVVEANVMNGVVRITLGQTGGDGKPLPAGQLLVPLVQLPSLTNGLINLVKQIESRVKEASESKGGGQPEIGAAPPPAIGSSAVPASFSFQKP